MPISKSPSPCTKSPSPCTSRPSANLLAIVAATMLGVAGCGGSKKNEPDPAPNSAPAGKGDVDSGSANKKDPIKPGTKDGGGEDSVAERDRDYFKALELIYVSDGLIEAHRFWVNADTAAFSGLKGPIVRKAIWSEFFSRVEVNQSGIVQRQRLFMDWHKIDMKSWRPEFMKRYPDRELVSEEVKTEVRALCNTQSANLSTHLLDKFTALQNESKWDEYRLEYAKKQAPIMLEEVVAAVKTVDSFKKMKAKVEAAR